MKTVGYPEKDIPPFSESFHKARKLYVLISAIILLWELSVIDVSKTDGILGGIFKAIKYPKAISIILGILWVYSFLRIWIEWNQADIKRRNLKISRIDFYISHGIGIISIWNFTLTELFGIEILGSPRIIYFSILLIGIAEIPVIIFLREAVRGWFSKKIFYTYIVIKYSIINFLFVYELYLGKINAILGMIFSLFVLLIFMVIIDVYSYKGINKKLFKKKEDQ